MLIVSGQLRMGKELGSGTRSLWEYAEFCVEALFALAVAWSFFIFIYHNKQRRLLPPGPFPLPVIGNLHLLGKLPHQALAALSLKYGSLMSLHLGSSALTLVLSSGEIAEEFLKTHDRLFSGRPSSAAIKDLTYNFSDVAFAPYGPYWRQMRKVCVLQLLSSRRIDSFRSIREEEVSAMIHSVINSNSDRPQDDSDRPLNVSKTVSALTNGIICRMAFGRKYSDEDVIGSTGFDSLVKEIMLLAGTFYIGDYIPYLAWMDHLRGSNRRLKNVHNTQDQFIEKVISEREVNAQNDSNDPRDLVDVLLAASADKDMELQITRDNIKAVLFDMLVGGMDTSSTTIEWAMSETLRNPLVLQKLQDELERVVGMGRMVRESDLPHLVYLQAVVKETLRLHPPGPFAIHLAVEDCTVLGYQIPRNTRVLINLWAIGRNPKAWGEDAQSFKPERFLNEAEAGLTHKTHENFEWIPFGAGRRGCPGQQLGTLVVEFAVAQLLHCFNWRLTLNGEELDMTEMFNGLTVPRAHELLALPTPRLPVL